jgi:hypothetical protein
MLAPMPAPDFSAQEDRLTRVGTPDDASEHYSDLAAGLAGGHLVCADLLLQGYRAFLSDQNCPYDIVVDLGDRQPLLRLQVKTTRCPRPAYNRKLLSPFYSWCVRRAGKRGVRVYGGDEFDIFALVALDTGEIAYLPLVDCPQSIQIRPTGAGELARSGPCAGCSCALSESTAGCRTCASRHCARRQSAERPRETRQRGKRFSDYPFSRALSRLLPS